MKVIDNFETFSESINTPSYSGVMITTNWGGGTVGNQFWTYQTVWISLDFNATSKENLEEL
jgi:hypothetical protein